MYLSLLIIPAYYISLGFSQVIRSIGFQRDNVSILTFLYQHLKRLMTQLI